LARADALTGLARADALTGLAGASALTATGRPIKRRTRVESSEPAKAMTASRTAMIVPTTVSLLTVAPGLPVPVRTIQSSAFSVS
jgi:hypothetical protein